MTVLYCVCIGIPYTRKGSHSIATVPMLILLNISLSLWLVRKLFSRRYEHALGIRLCYWGKRTTLLGGRRGSDNFQLFSFITFMDLLTSPKYGWWNLSLWMFNSLTPERFGCNIELVIFKLTPRIDILSISSKISLRSLLQDLIDD